MLYDSPTILFIRSDASQTKDLSETIVQVIILRSQKIFRKEILRHKLKTEFLGWIYSLCRFTSPEGTSQGEQSILCQGNTTRHRPLNHSFSDSWRGEIVGISSQRATSSPVSSEQQSHFSLFIRI